MKHKGLFIGIILIIICVFMYLVEKNMQPILKQVAEREMKQFCQMIVNHVTIDSPKDPGELVIITRDENQKVTSIDFNLKRINEIAGKLVIDVEDTLLSLEDGNYHSQNSIYDQRLKKISDQKGIVATLPLGSFFNNPFLAHVGPKISIQYNTLSHVSSSIDRNIEKYGINHIMVSIDIHVVMHLSYQMPFYQEEFTQDIQYPLVLEIIEGEVPSWYQN